jgi:transposase
MKANVQKIRKQRVYSLDFKKSIVSLFEKGEYSVLQLEQLYGINNSIVYNWICKYSVFNEKGVRIVEMKDSNQNKLKEL